MNFDYCYKSYENCESVLQEGVWGSPVEFPELRKFNDVRKRFGEIIRDGNMPEIWEEAVKLFAVIHAKLARTPCRPGWLVNEILNSHRAIQILPDLKHRALSADLQIQQLFFELVKLMESLKGLSESPLLRQVSNIDLRRGKTLFALRDTRLLPEVSSCLETIKNGADWEVVKPSALRDQMNGSSIVIFGPPWYLLHKNDSYLVRSPAAPAVYMIGCKHEFSGEVPFTQIGLEKKHVLIRTGIDIRDSLPDTPWAYEAIKPIECGQFSFKERDEHRLLLSGTKISAIPFRFSVGKGAFLKAESKVWTAILSRGDSSYKCDGVEKIDVEDLDRGHLVLMSAGGGGDMVSAVADMILKDAQQIRSLQQKWKAGLRQSMSELSWQVVAKELEKLGATRATYPNMLNWCNPRNIGMEDLENDLGAVLRLVNMSDRIGEVITGIKQLRAAHQNAGRQIANKLRSSLLGKDMSEAIMQGSMTFKETDGPALTVFLVEERGKETEIPEEWEGQIKDVDE